MLCDNLWEGGSNTDCTDFLLNRLNLCEGWGVQSFALIFLG